MFRFLFTALGVHLYLNQRERHLFVSVNDTAEISCFLTEDNSDVGRKLLWFWRGTEETVTFVATCYGNKSDGKYHCRHEPRSATLEIRSAQRNESGVYYCAYPIVNKLKFAGGCALIVGDSYTTSTSVELVTTLLKQNALDRTVSLVCMVRAVSGPVWVSWNIPVSPGQVRTSKTRDRNGVFTFTSQISVLSNNFTSGEVSCEVQFNASLRGVRRSANYKAISTDTSGWCVALMVSRVILLLFTLSATIYKASMCPLSGTAVASHTQEEVHNKRRMIVRQDNVFTAEEARTQTE
ncbi:hypothetical protein NDU88_001087 [Pleurodeles waltl]|uniref:Ig-like domain-containing protein n=1 Tax=Pleurodeles waltl TaxID=8319 RepID=A0AAV7KV90_PLEWA|nr:hypothetical protein NDU88_001087 [Pleurodeles waltl]